MAATSTSFISLAGCGGPTVPLDPGSSGHVSVQVAQFSVIPYLDVKDVMITGNGRATCAYP